MRRPSPTRTRSRATSVHSPSRTSTARRRSAAGTLRAGDRLVGVVAGRVVVRRRVRARPDRSGRGDRRRRVAGSAGRPAPLAGSAARRGRPTGPAPRDGRPGGGQPGRRAGIGQVEQDARELGPEEHGLGRPGVGQRQTGPPAGEPAQAGGRRRVGQAVVGEDRLDVARRRPSPSRSRAQRDRTVGRRRSSSSAHRMMVTPAGGSSSVLSRADWASSFMRSAPSMMATRRAALDRHERQLADEVADAAVLRVRSADDDLAPRARPDRADAGRGGRRARPAGSPARPGTAASAGVGGAQQPRREVERERRLADARPGRQQDGVGRRRPGPSRPIARERDRPVPGSGPVHGGAQAGSAGGRRLAGRPALRRRGRRAASPSPAVVASALAAPACGSSPGFGGGLGRLASAVAGRVGSVPRRAVAAAGLRVRPSAWRRRLGRRGRSRQPACARRELAGAARFGCDRRVGLGHPRSTTGPDVAAGAGRSAGPASGRPGPGACASSSGGTSLHGSFDAAGGRRLVRGRSLPRRGPRSSRGGGACCGPAADVGIAVDAAARRRRAVALALHRRLVGGPPAAGTAARRRAPPRLPLRRCSAIRYSGISGSSKSSSSTSGAATARSSRGRRPELGVPDRPERVRPRRARGAGDSRSSSSSVGRSSGAGRRCSAGRRGLGRDAARSGVSSVGRPRRGHGHDRGHDRRGAGGGAAHRRPRPVRPSSSAPGGIGRRRPRGHRG